VDKKSFEDGISPSRNHIMTKERRGRLCGQISLHLLCQWQISLVDFRFLVTTRFVGALTAVSLFQLQSF
jgi:hypothetical protein